MARSSGPDPIMLAAYAGGAFLLLHRGADGTSLLEKFMGVLHKGIQLPGAPVAPVAGTQPVSGAPPVSTAGQTDLFNFNQGASGVSQSALGAHFSGDVGFGHVGPGGTFVVAVKVRNPGISVFGITLGGEAWIPILTTNRAIGNDADWAGYDQPVSTDAHNGQMAIGAEWVAEIWGQSNGVLYASTGTQPLGLGL